MATVRAKVEIFGQGLSLRTDGDEERLFELARFVDSKMQEVAKGTSSVDTVKIAILTALNIADELFEERESDQNDRQEKLEKRTSGLVKRLEDAIKIGVMKHETQSGGPCAVGDG